MKDSTITYSHFIAILVVAPTALGAGELLIVMQNADVAAARGSTLVAALGPAAQEAVCLVRVRYY
jgi:hypothetical protein